MKKDKTMACRAMLFMIIVNICMTSCKNIFSNRSYDADGKISFKYNGNSYSLLHGEGWGLVEGGGIHIDRPDIFNGHIYFYYAGSFICGYLSENLLTRGTDCGLTYNGGSIDSVQVYVYYRGSYDIKYKNCRNINGVDFWTGISYTETKCDGNGTFTLVLKNKENRLVELTDGKIEFYNYLKR